jgi:hypothetical protein
MNLTIPTQKFLTRNVSWLETKNNTIMTGTFTKICYNTPHMTMNGLYLYFPVVVTPTDIIPDKTQLKFNSQSSENHRTIKEFTIIEHKILDNYIQIRHKSLKKVQLLSKQLLSGFMKVYKETNYVDLPQYNEYCVKISGVWETHNECGLTYKLFGGMSTTDVLSS